MTHYIVVSENEIVKAEMERPEFNYQFPPDGPSDSMLASAEDDYQDEISAWEYNCLSLPRIPIKGKHNWKVWQEVKEGKDFRIEIDAPFPEIAIPIEQTKSEQNGQVFGEWQLCPKCNGQGMIEKLLYLAAEETEWIGTGVAFTCDVCNGAKVLARPLLNINPQTKVFPLLKALRQPCFL